MDKLIRTWALALGLVIVTGALGSGCGQDPALLIQVTADTAIDQYDLYIREDASNQVIFHSGFNPVLAPGEKTDTGTRDLTVDALKIAVKLSKGGKYTLLLVGVAGMLENGKPGPGSTQLFWAGHVDVEGASHVDARLLTVPTGDDADGDFWPDVTDFPAHVPEAAQRYAGQLDLLDCNDKTDNPPAGNGMQVGLAAADINPFAPEICSDGYDENCNGDADEPCVDKDGDGDPRGSDCDDNDPARHKPNPGDPFPDPPNCCGYSLGKAGTAEEHTSFAGDPILCPKSRCGNGIDESCRGNAQNDTMNDTACVVDADCDGYPAAPQGDDCDDNDPNVHPGALEICGNGKNESCAEAGPDSGCVPCDVDGDGFQRDDAAANCPDQMYKDSCKAIDCNDDDAGVYPGSASLAGNKEGGINVMGRVATAIKGLCRRVYEPTGTTGTAKIGAPGYAAGDADCNGSPFEGCPPASCDADGDGWPANDCGMGLGGPFDCNDNDPTIFPSAPDKCGDGIDGSCSGADTPCAGMDADGDGYVAGADCDDSNPNVHPFAVEKCNGIDDDCDGDKDEGNPDPDGVPLVTSGVVSSCTDDNDGECGKQKGRCVCSPTTPVSAKDPGGNRLLCSGETTASGRNPHCFGAGQPKKQSCGDTLDVDDDCDGRFDDPTGTNLAVKGMPCGLSLGVCKPGVVVGCVMTPSKTWFGASPPAGKSHWECSGDTIAAALVESCNGFDDDCDGTLPPNETDPDMDKYMACSGCGGLTLAGMLLGCDDCNPAVGTTYPGAPEKCDNIDNNCANGIADDGAQDAACTGKTCCSSQSTCRDLQNGDPTNCSACGMSCLVRPGTGAGQAADNCANGGCVCGASAACGSNFWCTGGACVKCDTNLHCGAGCTPCSGANVCKPDGSGCNECNVDTDCDATHAAGTYYCNGGNCLAKKAAGQACTPNANPEMPDNECLGTAYCTDGVCCDKSPSNCGGAPPDQAKGCKQCNRAGMAGTCTNAAAGSDPHGVCNPDTANCVAANCDGSGSCFAGTSSVCGAQSCVDNVGESHTYNFLCQAINMCSATQNVLASCGEYKCNGTVCRTSCTSDSQCVNGHCWDGAGGDNKCYPKKTAGDPCSSDAECNSGSCVSATAMGPGVCCGTIARPSMCPANLPPPSTTCNTSTNQRTVYTCSVNNSTQCAVATAACPGSLKCQDNFSCYTSCNCPVGGGPCNDAPECRGGAYCVADGQTSCSTCNVNAHCGSSTCVDCTASTMCVNGAMQNTVCGAGPACGGSTPCGGNFACNAGGTACRTGCTDDSQCQANYWCSKKTAGTGTCEARITSNMNCNDGDCATAGCKQCQGAVACPTGMGQQKCP